MSPLPLTGQIDRSCAVVGLAGVALRAVAVELRELAVEEKLVVVELDASELEPDPADDRVEVLLRLDLLRVVLVAVLLLVGGLVDRQRHLGPAEMGVERV